MRPRSFMITRHVKNFFFARGWLQRVNLLNYLKQMGIRVSEKEVRMQAER
jgi:hypothetical protein